MKRALLLSAILFSTSVASAGEFFFTSPRGFTVGNSTPYYTWSSGPRGYSFLYTPFNNGYRQPTNYYGGYGNTYNSYKNYGTIYAPQYNYGYGRR